MSDRRIDCFFYGLFFPPAYIASIE